jgi:hypothetical protein
MENASLKEGSSNTNVSGGGVKGPSSIKMSARRKLVLECKSLRAQIASFEQEWDKKYGRLPKASERGQMQATYNRYREMKKEIRDNAAIDIQRSFRGLLGRRKWSEEKKILLKTKHENAVISNDPSAAINIQNISSQELYARYRELLGEKRELKRKLKKFDEEFQQRRGRAPRKADKEVMRPLYQRYHEAKGNLDMVRNAIEASHGFIPEELLKYDKEDKEYEDEFQVVEEASHLQSGVTDSTMLKSKRASTSTTEDLAVEEGRSSLSGNNSRNKISGEMQFQDPKRMQTSESLQGSGSEARRAQWLQDSSSLNDIYIYIYIYIYV